MPQPAVFLCDHMCVDLGRWLRIAGYDTEIILTNLSDQQILKQAQKENRLVLTKDHHFHALDPSGESSLFLKGDDLDALAEFLKRSLGLNWFYRPFSRCLKCNTLLVRTRSLPISEEVRNSVKHFWECPTCKRILWRGSHTQEMERKLRQWQRDTLFTIGLVGDVMIGRLMNEVLNAHPPDFIWGNTLPLFHQTDFNLINLEAVLTRSEKIRPKIFNFKADPEKVSTLKVAHIDAVNLANNHVLDYDEEGLLETLQTLDQAHIAHVGAGKNLEAAQKAVTIEKQGVTLGIIGCTDNEPSWLATTSDPGVNYVSIHQPEALREAILALRPQVDILILSIHWGPNMRQRPTKPFRRFAHAMIDYGVDILHGHSAHLFQGVEIYKEKFILYDTGDFIDDYAVDPILRNDRSFFFEITLNDKKLHSLKMCPTLISDFQVNLSHDYEALNLMEQLCHELNSDPIREEERLSLAVEHFDNR